MAKVQLSAALAALSGSIGGMVFKRYGDKVVASQPPDMSTVKPSAAQTRVRERMAAANRFYTAIRADPALMAQLAPRARARGLTAHRLVIQLYMAEAKRLNVLHPPDMRELLASVA